MQRITHTVRTGHASNVRYIEQCFSIDGNREMPPKDSKGCVEPIVAAKRKCVSNSQNAENRRRVSDNATIF